MATRDTEIDFRAMPKIEVTSPFFRSPSRIGSISRQCLHEIWGRKKAAGQTELEDPLVVMPPDKHDYDLATFFPLFSSYIYHLVDDAEALEHASRAVVRDFAEDGVAYLELRTTPRALPRAGLDKAGYVDAVLRAIDAAQRESPSIRARLILSVDRRDVPEEARSTAALAARFRDYGGGGVVGLDLCGDPAKGDVSLFTPAFATARAAGLGLTVHFAEAEASAGEAELRTLLDWEPDRLGHVIHVPPDVRRRIAAAPGAIGLELCLSCNVHAKMIVGSFEAHHFGEWWRLDGPVVVPCTDDVGVFGSPLSNEWRLIQKHFHLSREEILGLARKGIDVIFGGEGEKQRLRELMW
ncbi:hypothetical protein DL764_007202 [Monosporascus ibericus]|uniref:Adenosine deaminase domain-containing protein n=1 Tax=Monosporascus ibericus TaxID=155417 RepID=A0A4V1X9V0_9PEZI|nr:hypothetical protein DL764_007202 [Monosporascus ibericus]